jgi:hypothetical protein
MIFSQKTALLKKPVFLEDFIKNKGVKADSIFFEQYKLFIHHNEEIRNRRQQMNTFFLTTNSLIMGALGTIAGKPSFETQYLTLILSLLVLGIGCICAWLSVLKTSSILTTKSYHFIKLMEEHLGAKVFTEFYDHLHLLDTPKERSTFTIAREKIIPYLFLGGYILYILIDLYNFVKVF